MSQRLIGIDALRGFAIVLMIIFHFCYDLRYFGYVDWQVPNGQYWWPFRYIIISFFVFTVGFSLAAAHREIFHSLSFFRRLTKLLLAAFLVTAMSFFLFPKAWIYFGILHFIALASVLSLPLLRHAYGAVIAGVLIIVGYNLGLLAQEWPFLWFDTWLPNRTEDFVPLFPWLGVVWLGLGLGHLILSKDVDHRLALPYRKIFFHNTRYQNILPIRGLAKLGRHGLLIYLIHQPIFFAGFYFIQFVGS